MLIRITNHCDARCKHCFIEGAGPEGKHMDRVTFERALAFTRALREPVLLLSGGEATDHPELELYVTLAKRAAPSTVLLSNGLFALDERRRRGVFALLGPRTLLQVTCDPRYYRRNLGLVRHIFEVPHVEYEAEVTKIQKCTRSEAAGIPATKKRPSCFNLRAGVRQAGSITLALAAVREQLLRTGARSFPCCTPSIDPDGTIHAGESDTCAVIGHVGDSMRAIERGLLAADCDACGTMQNLDERRRALAFPQKKGE